MKTYIVKEGKHDYKPNNTWVRWGKYSFRYTVTMGKGNRYNLGDVDQFDWNKGGGIANYLWSNFKMTAMWAFRYNINTNVFEMCGYFHVNDDIYYPGRGFNPTQIARVGVGETVTIDVTMAKRKMSVVIYDDDMNVMQTYNVSKPKHRRFCREVGAWFGGNETAPTDLWFSMDIDKHRI
tara:strand:+ start:3309 stop:3845 length:537 start_codon:yes stop_codon:yes gene_type:complete